MKTKKHKTGYRTGDVAKHDIPFPIITNGPKPKPKPGPKLPILWVKKNGKLVKATKTEVAKVHKIYIKGPHGKPIKKQPIMVGGKYVKKGGKV